MKTNERFDAWRALGHPLWLAALGLLLLNDHLLKGSGILPGVVTGKLSDVAGLAVAPALLAALVRVRSRRGFALAHVATGVVFSAINLVPAAAHAFEWLTALTPFAWRIVVDPSDLVALPALALSYAVLARAAETERGVRVVVTRLLAMAGGYACVATTQHTCPADECGPSAPRDETGAFALENHGPSSLLLRVRHLRSDVLVDCDRLMIDPSGRLAPELFAPAESWIVETQRALTVAADDARACTAVLVDGNGLGAALVAWRHADYPETELSTVVGGSPSERAIGIDTAGGLSSFASHPALFAAPPDELAAPGASCALPPDTARIDWTAPPFPSSQILAAVSSAPNGCHLLDFQGGQSMYLCLPPAAASFAAGETVTIVEAAQAGSVTLEVVTPTSHIELRRGALGSPDPAVAISSQELAGCLGERDACGSFALPLQLWVDDGVEIVGVASGGTASTATLGTLHLVRAEIMPVGDTTCGVGTLVGSPSAPYVEWAIVKAAQ